MSQNPEILKNNPEKQLPKVIELSREALAKKLNVSEDTLPDRKFFKIVDEQLDKLAWLDPMKKTEAIKEELGKINAAEMADKANELWEKWKKMFEWEAIQQTERVIHETAKTLKEEWLTHGKEAIAAIWTIASAWNLWDASKGIDSLSRVIESSGKMVTNAIKTIGELFSWLFKMLGLDKLFKSIGWLFWMKFDEKNEGTNSEKRPEVMRSAQEVLPTGPEKMKEKLEKAKNQYWEMLKEKKWITDPVRQKNAFDKLWGEKSWDIEKWLKNISENVIEGKKWNLMTDIFEPGTIGPTRFLLRLVTDGIIPKEAIFGIIGDLTEKSIKVGFQSAEALITQSPKEAMQLIGTFSRSDIEWLRPEEKAVLLASVHHNMALMLSLTGKLSLAVWSLALMPLYWDQGSGVTRLKTLWNSVVGDFESAGKNLDEMLKMLWDIDPNSPARKGFESMREIVRDTQLKTLSTSIYLELQKAWKTPKEIATELQNIIQGLNENSNHWLQGLSSKSKTAFSDMIRNLQSWDGEIEFLKYLNNSNKVSNQSLASQIFERMKSWVWFNPAQVRINDAIEQSENVGKSLANVVKNKDISLFKAFSQMRLGMKFEEFVASLDRGVLPIIAQDTNQAKGIMERFIRAIPPGFDHFFSSLTVALTIAHVSASDDKMDTFLNDLKMMNPFYGGFILVKEWLDVENNNLTKTWFLVAGGAVWSIGALQVSRVLSTTGATRMAAISEFMLGPIHTFWKWVLAMSRGISYSSLLAGNIGRQGVWKPFMQWRAFASYLMIAWIIWYYMYGKYSEENEKKLLTEKWILKNDGSFDVAQIKKTFIELPESDRSSLLEKLLNSSLNPLGISTQVEKGWKKTVVHSDNIGWSIAPIPLDVFGQIADTMKELWIWGGDTFLSKWATDSTKKYIAKLPISEEAKKEFLWKFWIIV